MKLKIETREATDYTPKRQVIAVLGEGAEDLTASFRGGDAEKFARLLVAAPELLAALEKLVFIAETVAHLRGLEREILPATDEARAAIAAAKGEKCNE